MTSSKRGAGSRAMMTLDDMGENKINDDVITASEFQETYSSKTGTFAIQFTI